MQISFTAPSITGAGALVVGASSGSALWPSAQAADKTAGGALSRAIKTSRFKGKAGQVLEILAPAGMKATRIILLGFGAAGDLKPRPWKRRVRAWWPGF